MLEIMIIYRFGAAGIVSALMRPKKRSRMAFDHEKVALSPGFCAWWRRWSDCERSRAWEK